jgi:hypothetical protein
MIHKYKNVWLANSRQPALHTITPGVLPPTHGAQALGYIHLCFDQNRCMWAISKRSQRHITIMAHNTISIGVIIFY